MYKRSLKISSSPEGEGGGCYLDLTLKQIEQLKAVEIDILKEFINICQQLKLEYFIVQGTLLGAVRHGGFIPWDDDIDVGMKREDYNVFLEKGQALLDKDYFLQNVDTDPEFPHGFSKLRKNGTTFLETTCKNLSMHHGIYIDIFPFDYYPDSKIKSFVFESEKLLLRYRIRSSLYIPQDNKRNLPNMIRKSVMLISRLIYPTVNVARKKQMLLYRSCDRGKIRANMGGPWGKKEYIPADWIKTTTDLYFEGIKVRAPINYKEYLSHVYGNYMELPPPEKRIPHHYISRLEFNKSYEEE